MRLSFAPVRMDRTLTLSRSGNVLTFNDEAVDLDAGETVWWILSARQVGGEWHVLMFLPHGAEAPHQTRFPSDITLTGDGPVALPPFEISEVQS